MPESAARLHLAAYQEHEPLVLGAPRAARAGHALVGRLTLGAGAWLGAGSIVRADGHYVRIGEQFHLGRGATVHIAHDRCPTVVHERVSVGANAVVHACALLADVVVDEDCVVLDGSVVGAGAVLQAGSVVFPRSRLAAVLERAHGSARAHLGDNAVFVDAAVACPSSVGGAGASRTTFFFNLELWVDWFL